MSLLIYSGLLYLLGVSIVIALKPEIMFSKDGNWKEFGLGRNSAKYTWMPFWLFAIMWAIMSYLIVLVIASNTGLGGVSNKITVASDTIEPENVSMKPIRPVASINKNGKSKNVMSNVDDMKNGYYLLDTTESTKSGVPKYVYLGPKAPNLVFHENATENDGFENDLDS